MQPRDSLQSQAWAPPLGRCVFSQAYFPSKSAFSTWRCAEGDTACLCWDNPLSSSTPTTPKRSGSGKPRGAVDGGRVHGLGPTFPHSGLQVFGQTPGVPQKGAARLRVEPPGQDTSNPLSLPVICPVAPDACGLRSFTHYTGTAPSQTFPSIKWLGSHARPTCMDFSLVSTVLNYFLFVIHISKHFMDMIRGLKRL